MTREDRCTDYLGDGVYAWWDGYQVWLQTGSHRPEECDNRIALDSLTFAALLRYQERLITLLNKKELNETASQDSHL